MDWLPDVSWWKLLWWLIGTVGVGGIIALCAAYPAVLMVLGRLFRLVFSYRIGCALVAAIVAAIIADYWRHSTEDAKHAAEVAAFEQAQVERDKRIARETREEVWKEIANATVENAVTDKDVKDFTDALPKPPETGNPFAVGSDACRLRAIYGQPRCGSGRVKVLPKPDPRHGSARN